MGSEPDFRFFLVSGSDPDFWRQPWRAPSSSTAGRRSPAPSAITASRFPRASRARPLSAGDFERSVAAHRKKLEAELAAEAKAQFDSQRKALNEALGAKEGALARFRSEELQLRRSLRELEEADKNRDVDYQRRLDEERRRIEAQFKAQIESAQREAADLKRKLEQGSQQLQGEALEL